MANFPASLDSYTTNVDDVDVVYAADVNGLQEAVVALETKVGADGSAVTTSHDYKLSEVTSTDKAVGKTATQQLDNKTLGTGTKVAIGSDADKDMYYRASDGTLTRIPVGTDNQIMKLNGTTPNWEAETTTVNGSTTVAGIFEAATSAQTTSGTAIGETGAALVVTPDALAASTPVFNGSGLTGLMKKVVSTTTPITQIVSSTTETTIYTTSIPANTLGTSNGLIIRFYSQTFNTSGGSITTTYRLKYGATTVLTYVETTTNGNSSIGPTEFRLLANASTSSQVADLVLNHVISGLQVDASGTASEDSTATKNLVITAQLNTNSANARFDSKNYSVHLLA